MDLSNGAWARQAWGAAVEAELERRHPDGTGQELAGRARDELFDSLPPGYLEQTSPAEAAWDLAAILGAVRSPGLTLAPVRGEAAGDFRLRRASAERTELSTWLPVLDSFGLVVVEAVPWHFVGAEGRPFFYVDDIGLRWATGATVSVAAPEVGPRLVEAVDAVTTGRCEVTPLNSLVVTGGLDWQEVNLLAAYCRYRHQSGGPRAPQRAQAMERALVGFPGAATAVLGLYKTLLLEGSGPVDGARQAAEEALAGVPDLEHDEALHELVEMVEATTRSTWALSGPVIALKFDSSRLSFLPLPRPFAEIYVWSTWFEGVHLRFGPVARGGIRWSDRSSDLRGEVLDLGRAQVKKNSLIVPTGAKGAFYIRDGRATAQEAYDAFIGALLDLTDNVVDGGVVHPPVVCRDGEDPYLVVAADKGTARFSDLANSISVQKSFWLGDAFASGGSNGYDHKALGITAKGAWLAVRHHFRALGMDASTEELRVVGVGDMSGDVFGNGMLCSDKLRLLAAFDHRHIFVDPTPAPEESFAERRRLAQVPASSWADYDLGKASPGAAVYGRHAKQAQLSPQAAAALGAPVGPMSPPELVRAVLMAPVDLIFFGGIGTFARGPGEDDADIEDHADDDIRLDAKQLRARVIAEGANLGLTQQARAAYSRRGGRVNADFVDNAAGVALSDREVNIKVLLGSAQAAGRLDERRRSELLALAQDEAAAFVLAQVDGGIIALDRAAEASSGQLPAYEALLRDLESEGLFDRAVEALPDDEELARRTEAGAGFSRPELAVLVAYARSELARSIERSALAASGVLDGLVKDYFPEALRTGLEDLVTKHPLARQLAASQLANEVLQYMGPTWAHETAAGTGRALDEVAAGYWVAREVLGAPDMMGRLAAEGTKWPLEAEAAVRDSLASSVGRLARWSLLHPGALDVPGMLAMDGVVAVEAGSLLGADEAFKASLLGAGVPEDIVGEAGRLSALGPVGELASVCRASGRSVAQAAEALNTLSDRLFLVALQRRLSGVASGDRWDRRQAHLLLDDLRRAQVVMSVAALAGAADVSSDGLAPGAAAVAAVEEYLAQRPLSVRRYTSLAREATGTGPLNLSLVAVVVRALSFLAQAGPEAALLPPGTGTRAAAGPGND